MWQLYIDMYVFVLRHWAVYTSLNKVYAMSYQSPFHLLRKNGTSPS